MFFEAYGWTPEVLLSRTMRELVAYSKLIQASDIDRKKFYASLMDKKLELPKQVRSEVDQKVINRIREMELAAARKHGFIK